MRWSVLFISIITSAVSAFTSKDSTEAIFKYSHHVELESDTEPGKRLALAEAKKQVEYLMGSMAAAEYYAIPKDDEGEVTVTEIEEIENGIYHIHYDYEGKIQVKNGPRTRYSVYLPRRTDEEFIYAPGMDKKGKKNLCTDESHNEYEHYSYFWAPKQKGCPLKEGIHYDSAEGSIDRLPNTTNTYPDYKRLARKLEDGSKEILIYMLFGMDDVERSHNPMRSHDFNAVAYRAVRKSLQEDMGFSKPEYLSPEEFSRILKGRKFDRPYVEVLTKESKKANVRVVLYFGETGIDQTSNAFHYFFKEAFENSSMLIFDGHTGDLSLDLMAMQRKHDFRVRADKKNYQIFMFNSCTSYTYYNTVFFHRKDKETVRKMTRNLEVLTNGLPTYFDEEQIANLSLIRAVSDWAEGKKAPSYHQLAEAMDQRNLFAVNGDEDNPTTWE